MKAALVVTLIAVPVAVGGFFLYRSLVPPTLEFIDQDPTNHVGQFVFNGITQSYGHGSATMAGRGGFDLQYFENVDGTITFNLLKNGVFKKQLAIK